MSAARSRRALPALLFALGLFALYLGALRTGFLNDYYLFLEQARRADLPGSLIRLDALGNYWRPLSRQIYFAALTPLSHGAPGLFHAVNFALFLAALALLADLLFAVAAPVGAIAGLLYFATLPFQRVAMLWISCSQDLVALAFGLAALALYRRARFAGATCLLLGAFAGKEAALPLPLAFAGWDFWIARRPIRESLRRAAPFAGLALAWGIVSVAISLRGAGARWLHFDPASFAAAYLHEAQSLIGLDHPAGFLAGLAERGPNLAALLPLSAIAWFVPPESAAFARVPHRAVAAFAITWLLALGVVVGPVAAEWSSYYFMLSAVGASVLVALATRNLGRWGWPALVGALLWWHAGSTGSPAFAVEENRWGWTSHLTSYYFERAAAITDTLSRQLRSLDPTPPRGARLFFATLPPWAGFQMGNGALVRHLYRDPSIESWFYSQYSESTAADRPCRFFWWDGRALQPLYRGLRDPSFQVGADLLLLDRPAGAAHAFRRGLVAGGDRADLLYWLGWAEILRGRRDPAEAAWLAFGARDDSTRWASERSAAREALAHRDTLATRRHLAAAIASGIGRPIAHAALGELLLGAEPKYALMELSIAVWIDPSDLRARRLLSAGLAAARLDPQALRNLEELERRDPEWTSDPELADLDRELRRRNGTAADVTTR